MRWVLILAMLIPIGLFSMPMVSPAWSDEGAGLPPIAQPVVREGDFAVALAEALEVGNAQIESEAESDLVAVGISPPDGWMSDYPLTPDLIDALYDAVDEAADAGRLDMTKQAALEKYEGLIANLGLPIRPDEDALEPQEGPAAAYGPYSDPSVVSGYYYDEGPPEVTYYTPPGDYYYDYQWVPCPFWWNGYWFSGFFVLNDFHTFGSVVIIKRHRHRFVTRKPVTNHYYHKKREQFGDVEPMGRPEGHPLGTYYDNPRDNGFRSNQAHRGPELAYRRHSDRARPFTGNEAGWRNLSSPGFRQGALHGQTWSHGPHATGNIHRYPEIYGSNDRVRQFQGSRLNGVMGQRYANRFSGFERGGSRFVRSFSRGGGSVGLRFSGGRGFSRGRGR
jgi:hypothetical protein